jgi:hypothetical protein
LGCAGIAGAVDVAGGRQDDLNGLRNTLSIIFRDPPAETVD